jgi:hypothetical protein
MRASASCCWRSSRTRCPLDLTERRVDGLERAELLEELGRRLRPDAGDAGNVVGRIAHEREQIPHLRGRDAEFLDDLGRAVDFVPHRVPEHHARVVDELHEVFVARRDDDAQALLLGPRDGDGDEIVGLEVLGEEDGDAVGLDDLLAPAHLDHEVGGGGGRWAL